MTADSDDAFTEEISEPCPEGIGVTIDDFVAYMPTGVYIFTRCREMWIGKSVNARLEPMPVLDKQGNPKRAKGKLVTIPASRWLDQNRPVEQMTWCPGFPMLIKDRLVVDCGWIERADVTCFNHYREPRIVPGDAAKKTDGIYLPADDRRHYIAWSNFTKEDFTPAYWNQIWGWYHAGGFEHIAAYLAELDISTFDPKAPPPKTPAFWDIVNANSAPEDAELADAIDKLGSPNALTINQLIAAATAEGM